MSSVFSFIFVPPVYPSNISESRTSIELFFDETPSKACPESIFLKKNNELLEFVFFLILSIPIVFVIT